MKPETEKWLQEVRARLEKAQLEPHAPDEWWTDISRLLALVTEQAEEIGRQKAENLWLRGIDPNVDTQELWRRELPYLFRSWSAMRVELESLRSETNRAGFTTITDVLSDEEAGDLEANEILFNRGVRHAVEVVERKREAALGDLNADRYNIGAAVARNVCNDILAELRGEVPLGK